MRSLFVAAALAGLILRPAAAQVVDAFTDGDFTTDPAWSGPLDRWTVAHRAGNPALRLNGDAARDTLYLSTPSSVGYGVWRFTFAFAGVNLSTSNGARVYLVADAADLRGPVHGYYLQFGTNNTDEIRLYRQDGDPSRRVELGRSGRVLDGDSATVAVVVTRTADHAWTVAAGSTVLFRSADATYDRSRSFGFWVKHTPESRQAFFFDDVDVSGEAQPADREPPRVAGVEHDPETGGVYVAFSEPVDAATLTPDAFLLDGAVHPAHLALEEAPPTSVLLIFGAPLPTGAHRLAVRNVRDLAGNLLAPGPDVVFDVGATPARPPLPGEIVVNELLYAPAAGVPEFVELYNRAEVAFDLSALGLADDRRQPVPLTTRRHLLAPGGYAVLTQDTAAFRVAFPGVTGLAPAPWPTLNNGGDIIHLFSGATVIDAVAYGASWAPPGVSAERVDPAGPSSHARNFSPSRDLRGATPGAQNSRYAPDRTPPRLRFVDETAEGALEVFFDEPVLPAALLPERFALDGRAALGVTATSDTTAIARFPAGTRGMLEVVNLADLSGNVQPSDRHPVARTAAPGEVVLNELLFSPLADRYDNRPDQPEYLELYNGTDAPVSLRGWYRTRRPDERGNADTLRLGDGLAAVPPGGYAVVFAQPTAASAPASVLAQAFPSLPTGSTLLPQRRSSLNLVNTGDLVRLHRRDGLVVDALAYHPSWHDPSLHTTIGVSLERLDPHAPTAARTNWTSSRDPEGGTPGRRNSAAPVPGARPPGPGEVVLNELLFAPLARPDDTRAEQPEFVELYNRTDAPLDLNGLYWVDAPDEEGGGDTLRFSAGPAVVPPNGYAVVFGVPSSYTPPAPAYLTDAFPSARDARLLPVRRAGLGLGNEEDTLRLFGPDGVLLDAVSYRAAWHHPNLVTRTGTSLERIDPAGPTGDPTNWSSSIDPAGATPGQPNSLLRRASHDQGAPGLRVEPNPFSLERDGVAVVRFRLRRDGGLVRVQVFDAGGRLVRTLAAALLAGREGQLAWDGLDDAGRRLPVGLYVIFLESVDTQGGGVEAFKAAAVLARPLR